MIFGEHASIMLVKFITNAYKHTHFMSIISCYFAVFSLSSNLYTSYMLLTARQKINSDRITAFVDIMYGTSVML
jgi:hypothetical protein